jgi:hypothetical protein
MSSVEAFGRWLNERPRKDGRATVTTKIRLDREANRQLLYLSKRFAMPKKTLAEDLLRTALKDVFAIVPGDPVPNEMIPCLHDAGIAPEAYKWFDLGSVDVEEEVEELETAASDEDYEERARPVQDR